MSRVSLGTDKITPNVRRLTATGENEQLVFTFANFHLKPVNMTVSLIISTAQKTNM